MPWLAPIGTRNNPGVASQTACCDESRASRSWGFCLVRRSDEKNRRTACEVFARMYGFDAIAQKLSIAWSIDRMAVEYQSFSGVCSDSCGSSTMVWPHMSTAQNPTFNFFRTSRLPALLVNSEPDKVVGTIS